MPDRAVRVLRVLRVPRLVPPDGGALREGFDRIRAELGVPVDFPPGVLAEAEESARAPVLPADDVTDVPFLTIDPPGSTDLDQALHIERLGTGYRVSYAIADLAAFVRPGGPVDAEAHRRVQTLYAPDGRTPLHPPVLSEGAASLLAGQDRPALVWTLDFDGEGVAGEVGLRRAMVRSREQLTYEQAQAAVDTGAEGTLALLAELGPLRLEVEAARGGVSLPIPEQEVVRDGDAWRLELRRMLPVEAWNAQMSLATGMAAAALSLAGGVGVLRTLPPATPGALARLRRAAAGLGVEWGQDEGYPELVRRLDPRDPRHAALLQEATGVLRGAGYTTLPAADGTVTVHAAIAAPYCHTTAPIRRLVDRYVGEVCLALVAGAPPPEWALAALPALPAEMAAGDRIAGELERACVDLVEAAILTGRVGEEFQAVVVDVSSTGAALQLLEPPVRARGDGPGWPLGEQVSARLVEASLPERRVRFVLGG